MDDIIEFLRVYPLNSDPSDSSKRALIDYPSSYSYSSQDQSSFQNLPLESQTHFRPIIKKEEFLEYPQDFSEYSPLDLKSWYDISSPDGAMLTRAKSGQASNQVDQSIKRSDQASIPAAAAPLRKVPSSRTVAAKSTQAFPQMPVLTDARDDGDFSDLSEHGDGLQVDQRKDGKIRKERQRASGTLSAHAVYARMNRERKKKYLLELEQYRKVMKRKGVDSRKELMEMHKETDSLTQEIAILRNQLVGNDTLMMLLTAGPSQKD